MKVIYEESKTETRGDFLNAMRKGDRLVVDGLHRFGTSRIDLLDALHLAAEKGITIEDARTGRTASAEAAELVAEAFSVLAGEARVPTRAEAVRRGKMGGGQPIKVKGKAAMRKVWREAKSNAAAAAATGLTVRTLYRLFGPSGRPAGWKRRDD